MRHETIKYTHTQTLNMRHEIINSHTEHAAWNNQAHWVWDARQSITDTEHETGDEQVHTLLRWVTMCLNFVTFETWRKTNFARWKGTLHRPQKRQYLHNFTVAESLDWYIRIRTPQPKDPPVSCHVCYENGTPFGLSCPGISPKRGRDCPGFCVPGYIHI